MNLSRLLLVAGVSLASVTSFAGVGLANVRGVPNKPVHSSGKPFLNPQPLPPRKAPGLKV